MKKTGGTTAEGNSFAAVGASAGGLEAFSQLLRAIPNNTGMAFVFIQHLDPKHHSMLSELLAKASNMPVLEATHGTAVKANHVYVIPPNVNMGINRHRLQLTPRAAVPGLHTPIDFFMRSLAEERNSRSIGVVLSGTASDGTRGQRASIGLPLGNFSFLKDARGVLTCLSIEAKEANQILAILQMRGYVHGKENIRRISHRAGEIVSGSKIPRLKRASVEENSINRDPRAKFTIRKKLSHSVTSQQPATSSGLITSGTRALLMEGLQAHSRKTH